MKLVFEMEDQTRRLASEAARGGEGEMRGNEEVRNVGGIDFSRDSGVVAGRARVLKNSATIGSDPDETEDSGFDVRGCGAKVVNRQVGFGDLGDRGQMERRVGCITDSNDGFWV